MLMFPCRLIQSQVNNIFHAGLTLIYLVTQSNCKNTWWNRLQQPKTQTVMHLSFWTTLRVVLCPSSHISLRTLCNTRLSSNLALWNHRMWPRRTQLMQWCTVGKGALHSVNSKSYGQVLSATANDCASRPCFRKEHLTKLSLVFQ
jgi:hypothetical protein